MEQIIEQLKELPVYAYPIIAIMLGSSAYHHFKSGMDEEEKEAAFSYAKKTNLTTSEQFAVALDAVMTSYWEVDHNTLSFTRKNKKPSQFDEYMSGWFINTREGYQGLAQYFIEDGRREYFDFIYPLYLSEPKKNWKKALNKTFEGNSRPADMLARLSNPEFMKLLKQYGVIESDTDLKIGIMGWDVGTLVGQARRAYAAELISEQEAKVTIKKAAKMAKSSFSSWEEFGRSQAIGMALDYYGKDDGFCREYLATYRSILTDKESPWKNLPWEK